MGTVLGRLPRLIFYSSWLHHRCVCRWTLETSDFWHRLLANQRNSCVTLPPRASTKLISLVLLSGRHAGFWIPPLRSWQCANLCLSKGTSVRRYSGIPVEGTHSSIPIHLKFMALAWSGRKTAVSFGASLCGWLQWSLTEVVVSFLTFLNLCVELLHGRDGTYS